MNRFPIVLLAMACAFSLAPPATGQSFDPQYLQGLAGTSYRPVHSEIVGRSYHIYVRLPDGYSPEQARYPVVYALDGGALFPLLSSYSTYLEFGDEMPSSIIVGVSYGAADFEGGNMRGTDYTAPSDEREHWGGAGKFQQFLREELIPLIESEYHADPSKRVLFGQSIGGQFVLYTAQTDPTLFWGHIASNPALHRNLDFFLTTRPDSGGHSKLFVASATGDDPVFRGPALEWIDHWAGQSSLPWDLEVRHLEGHSHMSAPPVSFREGMRWLFDKDR
jgi:predicted alpha/beta superfamily hydrolase